MVRARESELAEARHTIERARAEITTRDKEAAASVERNRVAWNSERETLLAQAEENAKERVKHALERWQNETAALLAKAQQEWIDAEETRMAVAEMQWRENIGIAKSRAPIAKMTKTRRWVQISGRAKRFAVIAICLAAAVIYYPRVQPVVVDRMWPKIVAFKGDIEPSLRETSAEIKAWIADVVKRSKAAKAGKKPREQKRKQ